MKLELVTRRDVSYVELQRDKKHSLGFTIKEGTQKDARPVVKSVKINGPAEKSFAVSPGDVVLSVNGISTAGKKINDVRRMLDDAGSTVNLELLYKTHETRIQGSSVYKKQKLTVRLQKVKGSFGFLLRKCSKYSFLMEYPVISNIKDGSPIYKCSHVQEGDRLLMIDNIDLSWMSLAYVASLLEARDEAEFTIEYNVGVVNFSGMDTKINLEIDAPFPNLGIGFRMCDEECSVMYISDIQKGSIAERCGVFFEGDVISSINDIDASYLSISKAYFLLRKIKKTRKISFILNRREEIETLKGNASAFSEDDAASLGSFTSDVQSRDWEHMNTPISSNFNFSEHQKYNFQNCCYAEQIKSMDKFQSVFSTMSGLKQTLSELTCQAFKGTHISLNQNCTVCNITKHAVKLCTSCLAKMNVKCAQSMDALRELIVHFIKFSSNIFDESHDQHVNISLKNIIHMLRETLPDIFRIPQLQEELSVLAEKIACADTSCNICDGEIKNVMMISKQLLLILSITDNSEKFTELAEHLICCLLNVKFPCCTDSGYSVNSSSSEKQDSSSEAFSEIVCNGTDDKHFLDIMSSHPKNNSENNSDKDSLESIYNTVQLKTEVCHEYLTLTHIQSTPESKNSISLEDVTEFNRLGETLTENSTLPKKNVSDTYFTSFLSDDLSGSLGNEFLKNEKLPKIWKSLDALPKVKKTPDFQNLIQKINQSPFNQDSTSETTTLNQTLNDSINNKNTVQDLNQAIVVDKCKKCISKNKIQSVSPSNKHKETNAATTIYSSTENYVNKRKKNFSNLQKRIFSKKIASSNDDIVTDVNSESTSSSSRFTFKKRNTVAVKKTYPDTMRVTLKKDGVGFGLGISDKLIGNELPIIDAIEPKSSSHKLGLLKLGDRILTINGVNVSKLSSSQFSALKNKALAAETITLTVEFDVCDEKYKFGLFDVVLEKTLRTGLVFEEMKKGNALIIKGIEKGSAAYRSGQIFPTDLVTYVKYKKSESFDPYISSFNSEQNIIITVMRDPKRLLELYRAGKSAFKASDVSVLNPSPCYTNPCFQREEGLAQSGQNFEVKKTAVHSSRKNSLVVDHEVTLYRDTLTFDFGILLSEDPTGRAYVSGIRPDGPAHKSGVIKKLDRILEINGTLVNQNVETSVLKLLSQANHKVDLLVRRIYRDDLKVI